MAITKNASKSLVVSSRPHRVQGPLELCPTADRLLRPPRSLKSSKRPPKSLIAELAPHTGFPETDIFDNVNEDGSRRSARARKLTAKAASESETPPLQPAKRKRPARKGLLKRSRAIKTDPLGAAAGNIDGGGEIMMEKAEVEPSAPAITEVVTKPAVIPDFGLEPLAKPGFSTPRCANCDYVCHTCADMTATAINLLESPDGRSTWYVGRNGIFEIGLLRFPRPQKSVTYMRGGVFAETWEKYADDVAAEAEPELDSDAETLDEEESDCGEEDPEEVDVEDLIVEWCDFCAFGQDKAWGSWLNPTKRPAHIDEGQWNKWHRQRADEVNARVEAKRAANPVKSWLEVAK